MWILVMRLLWLTTGMSIFIKCHGCFVEKKENGDEQVF